MKIWNLLFWLLSVLFFVPGNIQAQQPTQILYTLTDLGNEHWQYDYQVYNLSLADGIKEFTVWFEYGLYSNLVIKTSDSLLSEWDEKIWQPDPVLNDAGAYDALVLNEPILVGESISGFTVSFEWVGMGVPGPQFYEIIDPATFMAMDSGFTVPEPLSLSLWSISGLFLARRRHKFPIG